MTLTKFSERKVCKITEAEVVKQISKDMSGDEMRNLENITGALLQQRFRNIKDRQKHNCGPCQSCSYQLNGRPSSTLNPINHTFINLNRLSGVLKPLSIVFFSMCSFSFYIFFYYCCGMTCLRTNGQLHQFFLF